MHVHTDQKKKTQLFLIHGTLRLNPSHMDLFPIGLSSTHGAPNRFMSASGMVQWPPCLRHGARALNEQVWMILRASSPVDAEVTFTLSFKSIMSIWSLNMQEPEKSLRRTCWHCRIFSVNATLMSESHWWVGTLGTFETWIYIYIYIYLSLCPFDPICKCKYILCEYIIYNMHVATCSKLNASRNQGHMLRIARGERSTRSHYSQGFWTLETESKFLKSWKILWNFVR